MILLTKLDEPSLLFAKNGTFIEFGSEDERRQNEGIENHLRKLYYIFTKKATTGITPTVARRFD